MAHASIDRAIVLGMGVTSQCQNLIRKFFVQLDGNFGSWIA